jgi:hypothetical protein
MAKSKNNVVTYGLSGKIGNLLIFRQRNGQTVVSGIPKRSKELSEKQKQHHKHFQEAIIYAKTATADPDTKAAYQSSAPKGLSAYNMAVADMLHAPDIESIDLSNYAGQPGDTIRIVAKDDFLVKNVHVSIINEDGSLVEDGNATPDASCLSWTFTATKKNENTTGDKIVITSSDLPGNTAQSEQII